ncbi:MAG: hypothetical protein EXX96DRAFT_648443 [Benjaminiella poitrasii]|nr:MAG: hypothetical protein EXX96DRAFT_648443 [Benjaminiella poitrasii]
MRLSSMNGFSEWILELSYNPSLYGTITVPFYYQANNLFGSTYQRPISFTYVGSINKIILDKLIRQKTTFVSTDSVQSTDNNSPMANLPKEHPQTLNGSGLPPSKLELKAGMPDTLC